MYTKKFFLRVSEVVAKCSENMNFFIDNVKKKCYSIDIGKNKGKEGGFMASVVADKTFKITEKGKRNLKCCRNTYYAKKLGLNSIYVSTLLGGGRCRVITAKAFISICYGIPMDDTRMENLMEENFEEIKEE